MTTPHPPQPAPAILGRMLISLGVLALASGAFRLSLHPENDRAPAANGPQRTFTQSEALGGASALHLRVNGDRSDLTLDSADLPGRALSGQLNGGGTVDRGTSRSGGTLNLTYSAHGPGGLSWLTSHDTSWHLSVTRAVPTQVQVGLISGDLNLHLEDARLEGLQANTTSGTLDARLPAGLTGDVRLNSLSGDLSVRFGDRGAARPAPSFTANTLSGDQNIDLSGHRFQHVAVNSTSGDVNVSLAAGGEARVASMSGDVTVRVPAGVPVRLTTHTTSGDVSLPDDFTREGRPAGAGNAQDTLRLVVNTTSGDINIEEVQP